MSSKIQTATAQPTKESDHKRSPCPVACTLDTLGDKWTLLIIRDLFFGKSTFGDFQKSPERIPTNILADRLKRLEQTGIIFKEQYMRRPPRYAYRLTDKGHDLGTVLKAMSEWATKHIAGTWNVDSSTSPPQIRSS
ncbi:helix-turn-helix domain-containing protein [Motiliproteus sp. MSK22-1]|uniref:winged helix-turn-helix transcriptional regulator n=1 Tax=Motiliproteus sp. MSK22-1 TaxID=1897630 RepID=UPI000975F689|nr:helix-turn-helix domain-containing protein [Motiliproteus sp. MSK22-1]OMH29462.1 hypothetical protein BGP75_19635 [Motiliproteus sp. MSK22-1]